MTKKISQLPAATSVDTNDEFVINQDGTTKKLTTANQWDFANVNIDGGTIDGTAVNATTLTASGDVNFDSGTLFVDESTDRVGIGTTSPTQKLTTNGNVAVGGQQAFWYRDDDGFSGSPARRAWATTTNSDTFGSLSFKVATAAAGDPLSGTTAMLIDSSGNVGIGTSNPKTPLHILSTNSDFALADSTQAVDTKIWSILNTSTKLFFRTVNDAYNAQLSVPMVLERAGNVGIGTTAPAKRLDVNGEIRASTGILFGTDTAAANTLDDYEEGTWTPAIRGAVTAGTYELAVGSGVYTKIGDIVTISCDVVFAGSITGGGTGYMQITGIPFNNAFRCSGAVFSSGLDISSGKTWLTANPISSQGTSIWYLAESGDNVSTSDFPISGVSAGNTFRFTATFKAQ